MEDYQVRVIQELTELNDKRAKLEAYLLKHDRGTFRLMELQLDTMKSYAMILTWRIEEFDNEHI